MSRYDEIKENMRANIKSEASKVEGSFIMDNISAVATELARIMDTEVDGIIQDVFIDTASGIMLDKKASEFNEKRREAKYATGELTINGENGVFIPKGTLFKSDFGILYESLEDVEINDSLQVRVSIKCLEIGSIGNSKSGKINSFKDSLNGIISVVNEEEISGGVNEEGDESFRERIFEKIRNPIVSGNKNHYIYWAKQVPGILEAKVIPLANGNGTLKLIVLSSDYDEVQENILDNLTDYIENNRPVGASVEIVSAKRKLLSINMNLELDDDYEVLEIKEQIKARISSYLRNIAFDESKVLSFYKIGDIAFGIDGVKDVINYTINSGNVSLSTQIDEFFYLSEVVVNGS